MQEILRDLAAASSKLRSASTRAEELNAWAEWCKLWDRKEELEASNRNYSKGYCL